MTFNYKKLLKKVFIITFIIYFTVTIYHQQITLNSYQDNIMAVEEEIKEEEEYKESLVSLKENSNSLEYIETIAREKLNMYKPDEKVYRDR